jgi:hypothetical protein
MKHPCPECGAATDEPCKAPPPVPKTGIHPKRWEQKKSREDFSQAAVRIVREATEKD